MRLLWNCRGLRFDGSDGGFPRAPSSSQYGPLARPDSPMAHTDYWTERERRPSLPSKQTPRQFHNGPIVVVERERVTYCAHPVFEDSRTLAEG